MGDDEVYEPDLDEVAARWPAKYPRDEVGGVKVVRDRVLLSGLTGHMRRPIPHHSVRVLTLDDGTEIHGCRDCAVTGSLGDVKAHRIKDHGDRSPGRRQSAPRDEQPALIPMGGPSPAALGMSLAELLEMVAVAEESEAAFTVILAERDDYRARALAAETELKAVRKKLARMQASLGALLGVEES